MKLHSLIIDGFLDNAEAFRQYAINESYEGVTSPFDNIHYPDISLKVPPNIEMEIKSKLAERDIGPITNSTIFMRMSKAGVKAPHQAHTDKIMGDYTLLLYLNKDEDCQGGTDILKHIDGMEVHPTAQEEISLWERDANIPEQWTKTGFCPMKFNRAFVLRSDLFHRSQPLGGFGDTPENSRLVLIMFFNVLGES